LLSFVSMPTTSWSQTSRPQARTADTPSGDARGDSVERAEHRDTASEAGEQEPDASSVDESSRDWFDRQHRRQLYREGRLTYGRAALWTLLLPGLGNIYARQYVIGGVMASLMGFAALFVSYGWATGQSTFLWAGAGSAGTAYLGGLVTSYVGVNRYNELLEARLQLSSTSPHPLRPPEPRTLSITLFQF
jgi:hypothetical protein